MLYALIRWLISYPNRAPTSATSGPGFITNKLFQVITNIENHVPHDKGDS